MTVLQHKLQLLSFRVWMEMILRIINVKLGRAWGVGGKEFNNGVVLLISKEDHKLNISTGYGVEGALPDINL